jgi:hypothetical protein
MRFVPRCCTGPVTPGYTAADAAAAAQQTKKPPNPLVVRLTTAALMFYLQSSIGKQLKWLYPTNPGNADAWLEQEIYRCGQLVLLHLSVMLYAAATNPLIWIGDNRPCLGCGAVTHIHCSI